MNCEICKNDIGENIVLLPIRQPDGRFNTLACMSCSLSSGHYCERHHRPHLGFDDETSACTECIEDTVTNSGERIAGLLAGRLKSIPNGERIEAQIDWWYDMLQAVTGRPSLGDLTLAERAANIPRSLNIARLVVTRSLRMKITPEDVIEEISIIGAKVLLPNLEDLD